MKKKQKNKIGISTILTAIIGKTAFGNIAKSYNKNVKKHKQTLKDKLTV